MPKTTLKQPSELKAFPSRLSGLLKELDITQEKLEELSGVGQSTISRLMVGRENGGFVLHAVLIAQALNVRIGWLLLGEEPRSPSPSGKSWNADSQRSPDVLARAKNDKK